MRKHTRTTYLPVALLGAVCVFLFGVILLLHAGIANAAEQDQYRFNVTLSGQNEVPPVETDATGSLALDFATDTEEASFTLEVQDGNDITAAHLHCAPPGENGPPIAFLFGPEENGIDSDGELSHGTLTDADILPAGEDCADDIQDIDDLYQAVLHGNIYANVHNEAHPEGMIRGQLQGDEDNGNNGNENGTTTISVMTHICDADIQSVNEFDHVDGPDDNQTTQFHDKVIACPTVVMPGDAYNSDAAHFDGMRSFSFTITDEDGHTMDMNDATFEREKLCEADINIDVNGDNKLDACLDTSFYKFDGVMNGDVTVTERRAPRDTRPGALEFTPSALSPNNDADTLLENQDQVFADDNSIELDMTKDDDGAVTLHVYNFMDENGSVNDDDNDDDSDHNPVFDLDSFLDDIEEHVDMQQSEIDDRLEELFDSLDERFDGLFTGSFGSFGFGHD